MSSSFSAFASADVTCSAFSPIAFAIARLPFASLPWHDAKRMAVPAQTLRIVIGLIGTASVAGLSFCDLPLVRHMTHRTIRRRVRRFEMQARAARMAGFAIRRRLDLLVLQMTRRAWKQGH